MTWSLKATHALRARNPGLIYLPPSKRIALLYFVRKCSAVNFNILYLKCQSHFEVKSSNRLVYCELRTLKSSFTFAWQTPETTSAETSDGFGYSIDFDWVSSKLEAFRADYGLRNRKELSAEETCDSTGTCDQFELLLVDSTGAVSYTHLTLPTKRIV